MVQILESPKSFGSQLVSGLAQAAPGIGEALEKLAMKKQRNELLDKFELSDFKDKPEHIQDYALQQKMQQNAKTAEEERLEQKSKKLWGEGGMTYDKYKNGTPEQRAAFDRLYEKEGASFRKEMADEEKRNKPQRTQYSPFETKRQQKLADHVSSAEETIPLIRDSLANLDHLDTLAKQLTGFSGLRKSFFNTEQAKEYDNLGFTAIEPIIKLFNPVGPIPVAKVKIIREEFQPKASDWHTTQIGKTNALRRIAQQAMQRNQEFLEFMDEHDNNPSSSALAEFYSQTNKQLDETINQERSRFKEGKVKFDVNNPEHIKIRDEAKKKAGGDQKKAEQELNKMFL